MLLDQRSKALIALADPALPDDLRAKAKKAADLADVALGLQDAAAKKQQSSSPNPSQP
jgi:acyl-CoA hydrolase